MDKGKRIQLLCFIVGMNNFTLGIITKNVAVVVVSIVLVFFGGYHFIDFRRSD